MLKQENDNLNNFVANIEMTGQQLKSFREVSGMTQAELASLLNMERSNISKIESNGILGKRVLKQFLEGIWENGIEKICEYFNRIGVECPNFEIDNYEDSKNGKAVSKNENQNLIINNKGNFMNEENQYFKQKALMMDESNISELNRLKDENNQLKNSQLQKNSEIYNLKSEIVKLDGKIELADIRFNAALEKLKYELIDYVKNSQYQTKQIIENDLRASESKLIAEINGNISNELGKLQVEVDESPKGLAGLLESEHIQMGLSEVLKQSGSTIIMNGLQLLNKVFDSKPKQPEVPQNPFQFNPNMNYYQPENLMNQNENNFINEDVKNSEN